MLWRWRHSPLHRRFSRWLGFNALITLACTLLLLLHFRSRPDPINPLLRGDSRHFKVARGTADQTWRTASREVISDSENPVMHDSGVVVLPNGVHMPRLGFGTAGLGGMTERATSWALQAGCLTRRKRQNGIMRKQLAKQYALRILQETNYLLFRRSSDVNVMK